MIFEAEKYCRLGSAFDESGESGKFSFGNVGGLTIALLSRGAGDVVSGGTSAPVPAGSIIVANALFKFVPKGNCRILGVDICGEVVAEYAAQPERVQVFDSAICPDAPELMQRIILTQGKETATTLSATCYSLLCMVQQADVDSGRSVYPELISGAIAAVHEHFAAVYGVEELADTLGVNKSHLVRRFKKHVGITPGQYLTNVRIEAAKQLLLGQDYALELVAALCGFSSSNYFCKVFKKETGFSPREWRKAKFVQRTEFEAQNRFEEELYL